MSKIPRWLILALVIMLPAATAGAQDVNEKIKKLEQRIQELEAKLAGSSVAAPAAPVAAAAAQPAAAPAAPEPAAGSAGYVKNGLLWSAYVDGYYGYNFNEPDSRLNKLRNFDVGHNQFDLNYGELVFERPVDPLGFRVDLGFGRAADMVHAFEPAGQNVFRHIQQAYVSYKAPIGKGLQIDFGKFVTWLGSEVIETKDNYNYSRSLLFSWAIPYYHFGLRFSYPVASTLTLGGGIVNGWNNVSDNNTGKTYAGQVIWSPHKRVSLIQNVISGPERTEANRGWRTVFDSVVTVTATDKLTLQGNYDYGMDRPDGFQRAQWNGVSGAVRYAPTSWFALSPRIEYFNDQAGFATGVAQRLKEGTLTAEFKLRDGLISRLEYRRDWSNQPFFDRSGRPGIAKEQNTILGGLIFYFASPR